MDKKKIFLTILLAGILALIAVLFLCFPKKQTQLPATKENVIKEQVFDEEIEIEETVKEKEQEEVKQNTAPAVKPVVKSAEKKVSPQKVVQQKPKQRPAAPRPQVNVKNTETATPKTENVSVIKDDNGIVILDEFKTQNSYKYTYTPVRYKSK